MVVDFNREQEEVVKEIMRDYPRLVSLRKNKGWADAFLIALARCEGFTVVTEEKWSVDPPRIPYVCKQLTVPCIDLGEMIDKEGWVF
jgi:hypothetical protein